MNKDKVLDLMKKNTYDNIENYRLYGIRLGDFSTIEELKTLAHWALTTYQENLENGY